MMMPSIFGAEKCSSKPLTALAVLIGRQRGENTRDPLLVNESTKVKEINEINLLCDLLHNKSTRRQARHCVFLTCKPGFFAVHSFLKCAVGCDPSAYLNAT